MGILRELLAAELTAERLLSGMKLYMTNQIAE
jgi:hypothetical protein